ncbi:MAG: DEAD/DEAH box helicase [Actinomycetaceae bacterium]|nr:DEAD/DEAH box helicase [Actinomycetaceae bacterium]
MDTTREDPRQAALAYLNGLGANDDRLVYETTLPGRAPRFAAWPHWVDAELRGALERRGTDRLWSHQVEAATALHDGRHVIVSTGTGSGKSLATWLPYLSEAAEAAKAPASLARPLPTACYLAPTKALARDQLAAISALIDDASLPLLAATADGDAERDMKTFARTRAHVVVTNPDFVHHALLPSHEHWRRLLRSLSLVVLDEMHYYRGVFGAHVAFVLRRLLRLARRFGAQPRVAILSATTANPVEAAARFIGCSPRDIANVSDDGSGAGERTIIVWRPQVINETITDVDAALTSADSLADTGNDEWESLLATPHAAGARAMGKQRRSAASEGGHLAGELAGHGLRVLAFTRSRQAAESLADIAKDELARRYPELAGRFAAYRGGYLPEERREIEASLREGRLVGVSSTSALELGIDVSGLDATISCGWPGTRASWWQQSGRAGRAGADGISILVCSDNPLDAYLADHPDEIFSEVESSVFDTSNPYVLGPHLCCAAAEAPLLPDELALFGLRDTVPLDILTSQGFLRRRKAGWYWNIATETRPWDAIDLRGGGSQLQLVTPATGAIVGTIDSANADAQAHVGAIYVHQGRVYRVTGRDEDVAIIEPAPPKLRTRVTQHTRIRILDERATRPGPDPRVLWHFGDVEVERQVSDYDLLRLPGLEFIGNYQLDLPARRFATRAVWWTLADGLVEELMLNEDTLPGTLHAAEHASIGLLPLVATCDRWDLGGLSTADHPQTLAPTVFVYDGLPGGAGFAEYGYAHRGRWMRATALRVERCPCDGGCPSCVHSPKCGTNNEPLYKKGAADLLAVLAGIGRA